MTSNVLFFCRALISSPSAIASQFPLQITHPPLKADVSQGPFSPLAVEYTCGPRWVNPNFSCILYFSKPGSSAFPLILQLFCVLPINSFLHNDRGGGGGRGGQGGRCKVNKLTICYIGFYCRNQRSLTYISLEIGILTYF